MSGEMTSILDDLDALSRSEDDVSVGDVLDRTGHRSAGALLLVPGLIGLSPLGGIPTVPTLMALIVLILAVQVVIGQRNMWLPRRLRRRAVNDDRLSRAVDRMRPPARWIDRHFGHRLATLAAEPAIRAAALTCCVLALTAPALEIVPFAAAIPMGAIALLGIAITLRDGLLMALAFAASLGALWGAWRLFPFA